MKFVMPGGFENIIRRGVEFEFVTNTNRSSLYYQILLRFRKAGVVNVHIRPEAYNLEGRRLSTKVSAIFVERGQMDALAALTKPFDDAIFAACNLGVALEYFD